MADIFLSYNREDIATARSFAGGFERAGLSVWWDGALRSGEAYDEVTEAALREAKAVVVLWSPRSVASRWVRAEATIAARNKTLVPVMIAQCERPIMFELTQTADLSRWRGDTRDEAWLAFLADVRRFVEHDGAPTHFTPGQQKSLPHRRRVLIGGGAAILAAGGGAVAWRQGWLRGGPSMVDNSIAILPFANLSGDPAQAYFSDGLSEELRTTLSRIGRLHVAAQTSSNLFRDADQDKKDIAGQLGVMFLLEGSVRRAGNVVRIAAQLIDGRTGFDRWSQSFDRDMADIFAVQTEIATIVASALSVQIPQTAGAASFGGTKNAQAYDAFLKGRGLYEMARDEAGDRAALGQFDAALRTDPDYADAWAARSRSVTTIANSYAAAQDLRALYSDAIQSARRAVALAPDLAEAHAALGYVLFNGRLDVKGAYQPYAKARALGAGSADILQGYATYMARIGAFAEARNAIAEAVALDPLNPATFRTQGMIEYVAGRPAAANTALQKAVALNPETSGIHAAIGDILYLQRDYPRASAAYAIERNSLLRLKGQAITEQKLGRTANAQRALAEMIAEYGNNSLYQQAEVRAQWGDREAAIALLEKARDVGDAGLVLARNDPQLSPLRGEPRFTALLAALGFTNPV